MSLDVLLYAVARRPTFALLRRVHARTARYLEHLHVAPFLIATRESQGSQEQHHKSSTTMIANCMGALPCCEVPTVSCCPTLHGARPCWLQSRGAVPTQRRRSQTQIRPAVSYFSCPDVETSPGMRPTRRRILSTIATAAGKLPDQGVPYSHGDLLKFAGSNEVLHHCRLVLGHAGTGGNVSVAMGRCSPKWH